jgi:hypothetical protein
MPYIGRSLGDGVRARYIYAATSGQTTFSGNDANGIALAYSDTLYMDVYQNGVLLKPVTDYASTTGTSVVLTTGASTSDVVEMIVYDSFAVADTVSAINGGAFSGNISSPIVSGTTSIQTPLIEFTDGDDAIAIADGGIVTKPALPAFYVHKSGKQTDIAVNSSVTVSFETEVFDQGSNFASNTFTAPVNGFYHFSSYLRLENIDSAAGYYLFMWQIGGTQRQGHLFDPDFGQDNTFFAMNSSLTYYLTAGQTAFIQIHQSGGSSQTDIDADSWFSGHLVG